MKTQLLLSLSLIVLLIIVVNATSLDRLLKKQSRQQSLQQQKALNEPRHHQIQKKLNLKKAALNVKKTASKVQNERKFQILLKDKPWWLYINPVHYVTLVTDHIPILDGIVKGASNIVDSTLNVVTLQENPITAAANIVKESVNIVTAPVSKTVGKIPILGTAVDTLVKSSGGLVVALTNEVLGEVDKNKKTANIVSDELVSILTCVIPEGKAQDDIKKGLKTVIDPSMKLGIPIGKIAAGIASMGVVPLIGAASKISKMDSDADASVILGAAAVIGLDVIGVPSEALDVAESIIDSTSGELKDVIKGVKDTFSGVKDIVSDVKDTKEVLDNWTNDQKQYIRVVTEAADVLSKKLIALEESSKQQFQNEKKAFDDAKLQKEAYGQEIATKIVIINRSSKTMNFIAKNSFSGEWNQEDKNQDLSILSKTALGTLQHHPTGTTSGTSGTYLYQIDQLYVYLSWETPFESTYDQDFCQVNILSEKNENIEHFSKLITNDDMFKKINQKKSEQGIDVECRVTPGSIKATEFIITESA